MPCSIADDVDLCVVVFRHQFTHACNREHLLMASKQRSLLDTYSHHDSSLLQMFAKYLYHRWRMRQATYLHNVSVPPCGTVSSEWSV